MLKKCETCGTVFESIESTTGDKGAPAVCPKCDLKKAMGDDTPDGVSTPQKPARKSLFKRLVAFDFFGLLKNPLIIIMSIAGGILFGLFKSQTALMLKPIGEVYLSLLKMCVLPILITAIISSVGKLFTSKEASTYIVRIIIVFMVMLTLTGLIAMASGYIGQPGSGLSRDAQRTLGKMLSESDKKSGEDQTVSSKDTRNQERNLLVFIKSMIPENIFNALNAGSSLQILFFSLILGVATGFLPEIEGKLILSFSESLFKAFFGIISWILYLLPVGLFCLIASQIASTGVDVLIAMTKFVVMVYIVAFLIMIVSAIVIWISTGSPLVASILEIKDCLLIGFGTQSTFASMPSQLTGLGKLQVNTELANLVVPIGAVICRFSMVILYMVATLFTAQLYGVSLDIVSLVTALFLTVLAAVAGAGTPGIVSIAMVSIVLGPLGLPSGAIIVLLLAINPVVEPITTMANVHANVAATALIAKGM